MVTISGYKVRENKEGNTFVVLELIGSVELIQAEASGNWYATVRKCSMPSTLDEVVAKLSIGQQMPGDIVRVPCESYSYTVKRTGETISLGYRYGYQPEGSREIIGEGAVEIEQPAPVRNTANSNALKAAAQRLRTK